jgi:thiamine transporter ThiT
MKEIGILTGLGLALVVAFGVSIGFDLKTKRGWLVVMCGFVSGFLIGLSTQNLTAGVVTGIFLALFSMLIGPVMLRHRRRFGK